MSVVGDKICTEVKKKNPMTHGHVDKDVRGDSHSELPSLNRQWSPTGLLWFSMLIQPECQDFGTC